MVFPVALTFDQPAPGAPWRLSVQGPNEDTPNVFDRVTEFQPAPEQLNAYAGSYVSDEIEPVYRIAVEDGRLVLKRMKSKPDKLRPLIADYFESSTGDLHFERDKAGDVTGFLLNTGRIKNFKFRRAASVLAAR